MAQHGEGGGWPPVGGGGVAEGGGGVDLYEPWLQRAVDQQVAAKHKWYLQCHTQSRPVRHDWV